jgi:hypothetical protein
MLYSYTQPYSPETRWKVGAISHQLIKLAAVLASSIAIRSLYHIFQEIVNSGWHGSLTSRVQAISRSHNSTILSTTSDSSKCD